MAFAYGGITDVLNQWAAAGVFSYVLPFLLIFAVVFGVLAKSKILGENATINAIIALAIGMLSLQFDFVSTFFATIFPKFGIGLAVFLVVILLAGLFYDSEKNKGAFMVIGISVGVAVIIWAFSNWDFWRDQFFIGPWVEENFWTIVILIAIGVIFFLVINSAKSSEGKK